MQRILQMDIDTSKEVLVFAKKITKRIKIISYLETLNQFLLKSFLKIMSSNPLHRYPSIIVFTITHSREYIQSKIT